MSGWLEHLRSRLIAGLLTLLPAVLTLALVVMIFRAVDGWLAAAVLPVRSGEPAALSPWVVKALALLAVIGLVYGVGALATHVVGRRLLGGADAWLARLPAVGGFYRGFRQLLDSFGPGGQRAFRRSVLIEYPRDGVFRLAFVTNEAPRLLGDPPRPHVAVFIPSTPNPTSGFFVLVPPEKCRPSGVSTEEGLKMIVSGGIVAPDPWFAAPAGRGPADPRPAGEDPR